MIRRLLIANRGEIAVRIAATCRRMGIEVVAVHSDPDADAPHVAAADRAVRLPGETSAETYLQAARIVEIAREQHCDAVHPGYGFLSENAAFAEACAAAGIVFVGPPPAAIAAMGDKVEAKRRMREAGVPVVPGREDDGGATDAAALAREIGLPMLVKAAAGGGGKGMRVVREARELEAAIAAARREAQKAFGDDRVFLERYVEHGRHVEVQVFADARGRTFHLFERECSLQRRHQKVVEEAPSPVVDDALRERMGGAAVRAAEAIAYRNAGTVEFLLDATTGEFFFLEVNTRLQVEHPVTEMITGVDLVEAQLLTAAGEDLPFDPAALAIRGHAIECRIYAEDAAAGFLPSTGRIATWAPPEGPGIRLDAGVREGGTVSMHYDPMLAKLVVHAGDRGRALAAMREALDRFCVLGVTVNVDFLRRLLAHEAVVRGEMSTTFIDAHPELLETPARPLPVEALVAAVLAAGADRPIGALPESDGGGLPGPWDDAGSWRIG